MLTLIIVSGRLIKFLTYAASGELSPEFVLQSVLYRIPGMLVLILPLGLFLGVLLAYGRMYLESEMVVLKASGTSQKRLALFALGPAAGVALLVGTLGLYISPLCWQQIERIYQAQSEKNELDTLIAGRFQTLSGGNRTTYTNGRSDESDQLDLIFMSERDARSGQLRVILAESAKQVVTNPETHERFVVLGNGYRYEGVPGQADYREVSFAEYGFQMPPPAAEARPPELEAMTMSALIERGDSKATAELHWRLSMPLLALVVALIAVPMSQTNPRQGRYAKLIPSILLYMLYLTLLTSAKEAIDDGDAPAATLWMVHAVFIALGLSLLLAGHVWARGFDRIAALWTRRSAS